MKKKHTFFVPILSNGEMASNVTGCSFIVRICSYGYIAEQKSADSALIAVADRKELV